MREIKDILKKSFAGKGAFLLCWALAMAVAGHLCAFNLALAASMQPKEGVGVPIVMYHHISTDPKRWGKYIISPAELAADLDFLQREGYTPVTMKTLIDYVTAGGTLPEKPVVLSFDDGYESTLVYAAPLLEERGMQGVVAVVGEFTDRFTAADDHNVAYSHLTWEQLRELTEKGVLEVQNHSYDMHKNENGRKGARMKKGESPEAYRAALLQDVGELQKRLLEETGRAPDTFVYPYGSISTASVPILRELGLVASLSAEEGVSRLVPGEPESLIRLRRYNRPHKKSVEKLAEAWAGKA